jgi:thiamine biosynthesis lipoprotein
MGLEGPNWTARLRGYEAMTILADETVLSTPGFPSL